MPKSIDPTALARRIRPALDRLTLPLAGFAASYFIAVLFEAATR